MEKYELEVLSVGLHRDHPPTNKVSSSFFFNLKPFSFVFFHLQELVITLWKHFTNLGSEFWMSGR